MDKTFNDLMDIVNRTKKIDGSDRPKPTPKARPVVDEEDDWDYAPREYDVVEEKPKRTRTVKNDSPDLFADSAISKMLEKKSTKKTPSKSTTTKKATSTKATSKKATTTKKTTAKTTTTPKKTTTSKVSTPKLTKEDILSEIKVELAMPKKVTPKVEPKVEIDKNDPKNAKLYEALHNSLFSGGTDISEYMNMESDIDTRNSLQELRAKREAQKINAEITKEQQEYEQLFTGSLGSVFQDQVENGEEEESQVESNVNVAEKNAKLASELNAIKANLENKKNAPTTPVQPANERKENRHDATFELDSGNKDLDKKIAEYYRRKQEKINEYKAREQEGLIDEDDNNTQDNSPVDYESIFGGPMMTRDELLGIEREPEEETQVSSNEIVDNDKVAKVVEEEVEESESVVEDSKDEFNDVQESIENVEEAQDESLPTEEENIVPQEEEVQTDVEEDVNNEPTQNREEHIKSLLSDLLFSKQKAVDSDDDDEVKEEESSYEDKISAQSENLESQADYEDIDKLSVDMNAQNMATSKNVTKTSAEEDYASFWNTSLSDMEDRTSDDFDKEYDEDITEERNADEELNESTTFEENQQNNLPTEESVDEEVEEELEEDVESLQDEEESEEEEVEMTEDELLDSLTLNFGGNTITKDTTIGELAEAEEEIDEIEREDVAYGNVEREDAQVDKDDITLNNINDVEEFQEEKYESVEENAQDAQEMEDNSTLNERIADENVEDSQNEEAGFVLVDTPQIFGDFDEENPQEMTEYIERTPARLDDNEVQDVEQNNIEEDIEESDVEFEDIKLMPDTNNDVENEYMINDSQDVEAENNQVQVDDDEEYDEHFENVVRNERIYETSKNATFMSSQDDDEDNTYVVETLPEQRYDILGNEIREVDENGEEITPVVEEKKEDTISKEEFYNEMARLQENLINQLKGNNVQTEGRDLFEEKTPEPEIEEDEKISDIVDELIESYDNEEPHGFEEEEAILQAEEPAVVREEIICKAEPVAPEHYDDYNLLNKEEPLNDDDLAFQEKSEEEKPVEKDAYFYLSPEDNEKKTAEMDEYMTLFSEDHAVQKEVGDIHIFKNIGNATPSSEILKDVNDRAENANSSESESREDEVEAIYTLMGIERKPIVKLQEDMKVLYVASECQPFCASGGLGDVAGSLPKAIAKKGGVDIRVIMPLYGNIKKDYRDKFEYLGNFTVHLSWRQEYCGLFRYHKDGVTYYFVDNERYFKRDSLYGYYDDGERFAYFSKAVVEALPFLNFFPDIIHCNDWQTALVSAYIKTGNWSDFRYYKIKNIYTIHNVEYQGVYGMENLKDLFGIDFRFRNDMDYNGDINLTKGAIHFSDKFTTVSKSYCDNLKQPYCSRGLHHIIIRNEYKLSGIINGIDYDFYNPATDPNLFKNYDFGCMDEKVLNKKSWQDEMGLPVDGDTPMIAIVSRLVGHKGLDLVLKIIEGVLQQDVQLVVVGTGDAKYVDYFKYLEGKYPTKVRALVDKYSNENARKAYGASDIFVMPSKIEPCGISQMIASRYGSVPIVRETGGLKDTIKDFGCVGGGNGYTFTNYNPNDLSYQLNRAIRDYGDKQGWRAKMQTCMNADFTWNKPAEEYIELYKSICDQ